MKRWIRRPVTSAAAAAVETLEGRRLFATIYAVTVGDTLVRFDSAAPDSILGANPITGLGAGAALVAIDFRPATNTLYGIGDDDVLYTINPANAIATPVGPAFTPALAGTAWGADFNPTVDRLRVTSNTEQNLRINPGTGANAAVDTLLAYAAGDPNNGANPSLSGTAYTNNVAGATTTTLFGIDAAQDVLVTINPPNNGQLNTVGPLGFDTSDNVGFDIDEAGIAYASLTAGGASTSILFTVNLATGAVTALGPIGTAPTGQVKAMAVAPSAGAFAFSAPTYTVSEDGTTATVTITRTGGSAGPADVTFAASGGTATAGQDYTAVAGQTVSFAAGETSKTVQVTVLDNTVFEQAETVNLTLTSPTNGATLGTQSTAVLTITDDDPESGVVTQPDPTNSNRNQIVITGTSGDDAIVVTRIRNTNNVRVTINGVPQGIKRNPSRIVIHALAGDDVVRVAPNVPHSAEVHGDAGDDILLGGAGRDLLIGGAGIDVLLGRGGDDILVAGTTSLEATPLARLMGVWNGTGTAASRAATVRTGSQATGNARFNKSSLANDNALDVLGGGTGADLSFFNRDDEILEDDAGNPTAVRI